MADDELNEIKIILIGEPGTGKTCLINVATGNQFNENSESTLLSTYVTKNMVINDKEYSLNLWDTAGQEKYRAMTKIFTKNSKIVIFVYAINNKNTFEEMKSYWIKTIKETLGAHCLFTGRSSAKNDFYIRMIIIGDDGFISIFATEFYVLKPLWDNEFFLVRTFLNIDNLVIVHKGTANLNGLIYGAKFSSSVACHNNSVGIIITFCCLYSN